MAGASAEGEVNHWPAFVDVLTTVIMVVTFLLVIMSAAVMVLSQRTMQHFKAQMEAQEKLKHEEDKVSDLKSSSSSAASSKGQQSQQIASPKDAEAGTSIAELGSILRSDQTINSADKLTIRTRETKDTLQVSVKAMEQADASKGVQVQAADVLLKVAFEPTAVNFDADNSAKVTGFLKSKMQPGMKYEIWSFAPQTSSVSEAQRLAFYRAAMTRNLLIAAGIPPSNILTQIRVTDAMAKDGHNVRVVLKP